MGLIQRANGEIQAAAQKAYEASAPTASSEDA